MATNSVVWVPEWILPLINHSEKAERTLFLSDLHWGAGPFADQRLREMISLLQSLPGKIDDLVFGGDTFEFWWEKGRTIPHGHWEFLLAVRKASDAGIRVRFIAGNHDFAIGPKLAEICQARSYPDGFCLKIGDKNWLFLHGDAIVFSERFDRLVRKVLRSKTAQWAWHLLHPDLGHRLAFLVGHGSRLVEPGPSPSTAQMEPTIRRWIQHFQLAGAVHGHSHRPLLTSTPEGVYVNNGDWVTRRTAVWFDSTKPPKLVDCTQEGFPWLSSI